MTNDRHIEIGLFSDFRDFLRAVLEIRKDRTPSYSLRAFARDLEISPSRLSEILGGARVSQATARKLGRRLRLEAGQAQFLEDLAALESEGSDPGKRRRLHERMEAYLQEKTFKTLVLDEFKLISDWYHMALVEYFRHRNSATVAEAASYLGITPGTAEAAVNRLCRLGILCEEGGKLRETHASHKVNSQVPSEAIREFHRQTLQKAGKSLAIHDVAEREFNTLTFSVPVAHLPALKNKIREFIKDLVMGESDTDGVTPEVYCFSAQLFPLKGRERTPPDK